MWIERNIEKIILQISNIRPCILVTGCRQAGKTSLLKKIFPDFRYISLDIPLYASEAESAGDIFLQKIGEPVIIDEIQYAPALLRYIKVKIDEDRDKNGRFFVTGSQKFSLMQGVSESLAGRVSIITCLPLSLAELEKWYGKQIEGNTLIRLMFLGGYPELHAKELDPERFFSDYIVTYLERDVRQIVNVKNLRVFDTFLRLLALRSGQILSSNSLASEVGVSAHTIKSWIDVLEASNIIYLLKPYYANLGKRLIKSPKIFFLDTGLLAYLLGIHSEDELIKSSFLGAFFETLVLGQLLKAYTSLGKNPDIYFYRDLYGHEIDFIIPRADRFHLIECKWSASPEDIPRGFLLMEKLIGKERILSKTVINQRRGFFQNANGIVYADCVDWKWLVEK
ncbi:MAG: ATP-binding protein [Spirochaetota bacterium]